MVHGYDSIWREAASAVIVERNRLREFCERLENRILEDGDPFSGDDHELLREVRVALGKHCPREELVMA